MVFENVGKGGSFDVLIFVQRQQICGEPELNPGSRKESRQQVEVTLAPRLKNRGSRVLVCVWGGGEGVICNHSAIQFRKHSKRLTFAKKTHQKRSLIRSVGRTPGKDTNVHGRVGGLAEGNRTSERRGRGHPKVQAALVTQLLD